MAKNQYQSEFEINASPKVLNNYLITPGGLSEWFADDVNVLSDNSYRFVIDGEEIIGKILGQKQNKFIKIQFQDDEDDPSVLEIILDQNELTQAVYVVVKEYSDQFESDQEHYDVWEGLVDDLRDLVGG